MLPGDEVDGSEYLVSELSATLAALTTGFGCSFMLDPKKNRLYM